MGNRGLLQAAGSWSLDACCAVHGNDCHRNDYPPRCYDRTSSSDWLFGLWPGPPQRFDPSGADTDYQTTNLDYWPMWGGAKLKNLSLAIGYKGTIGGGQGRCRQGTAYRGTDGEICGGTDNWGAADVEVWYPI